MTVTEVKNNDLQLNNVFGQFEQANITDLILDLRYNSVVRLLQQVIWQV